MRRRHAVLLAALSTVAVAAIAACTLNPQPLPPSDFAGESSSGDASAHPDSGSFGGDPQVPGASDAGTGTPTADVDGGVDADLDGGDGGDGGDASDAGDAADGG